MSQGKTAQCSTSEVAAHCKSLEVSPSVDTSKTSHVYASGGQTPKQHKHSGGGKTHSGKRGTKETPQKLSGMHHKRGH
jgi:hypothetical protein